MYKFIHEILTLLDSDKKRLPQIFLLFLFTSLFELAGVGLIGPYVAMVSSPTSTDSIVAKLNYWIDLPADPNSLLILMGLVLLGVFFVKAITIIWINFVIVRFSEEQQVRLRSLLMRHYMSLSYAVYLNRNSSEYINSIQNMVSHYANAVNTILRTLNDSFVAIIIMVFLAWANPLALSILIVLFGLFLVIYDLLFKKYSRMFGVKINLASTTMLKAIHEGIEGLKEVRILNCEKYFQNQLDIEAANLAKYNTQSAVISIAPRYILEFILVLFVVLLCAVTIMLEQDVEKLLPTLAMFGVAAIRLLPAANGLSSNLMRLRFYRDSVSKLYLDLSTILSETPSTNIKHLKGEQPGFQNISLKKICFRYPSAKNDALHQLSIDIKSGESIGLIGSSGSGKTTLVDTLLGMLKPQSGEIMFNGKPLQKSLAVWRSHVAYLPQQVFLIDDTLRKNVALGIEDNDIDEQRLTNALKMALLSELVEQLSDGVDTMLGEKGVRLSGGQRQRVALARAFYHERDVLVLDEATSALDNETEREIVEEIQRLKGKKTMIVIAHRLSTVKHCDRIYKLENGKIVASGTPQEILDIN